MCSDNQVQRMDEALDHTSDAARAGIHKITAWFNWIVLNTIVLEQATYVIFSIELSVHTRCSQITRFLRAKRYRWIQKSRGLRRSLNRSAVQNRDHGGQEQTTVWNDGFADCRKRAL
jgi:hypothetical protein